MNINKNVIETIGNTPLIKLNSFSDQSYAYIYGKLEYINPGLSVKDRIAKSMIENAESEGKVNDDTVIIEPTSGNTGIGLALVCAVKGYRLILTMPESMSIERRKILRAYGAEIVLTGADGGMNDAISKAKNLMQQYDNSYMPLQFENPSNPEAHRRTTGQEIWRDTDGQVDILVAGVGTGGTITGTSEALKQKNPDLITVAVEPEKSAVLSGDKPSSHSIQGMGAGFIPEVLNTNTIDEIIKIKEEEAFQTA